MEKTKRNVRKVGNTRLNVAQSWGEIRCPRFVRKAKSLFAGGYEPKSRQRLKVPEGNYKNVTKSSAVTRRKVRGMCASLREKGCIDEMRLGPVGSKRKKSRKVLTRGGRTAFVSFPHVGSRGKEKKENPAKGWGGGGGLPFEEVTGGPEN